MSGGGPSSLASGTVAAWFEQIERDDVMTRLVEQVQGGGSVVARGVAGSSAAIVAAALHRRADRPLLLVVAHLDEADEAADELEGLGIDVARFPAMELVPGESRINLELLAERLTLLKRLDEGKPVGVLVAAVQALMQTVPSPSRLASLLRIIRPGDPLDPVEFATWLIEAGYDRVEALETPGEFAVRGGIVDVFPPGSEPVRIDLFGDEVEAVFEIDLETMGSDRRLGALEIVGARPEALLTDDDTRPIVAALPTGTLAILVEAVELAEQARGYVERVDDDRGLLDLPALQRAIMDRAHAVVEMNQFSPGSEPDRVVDLPVAALPPFPENASEAVSELVELAATRRAITCCQNEGEASRMGELLEAVSTPADVTIDQRYLHRGFTWGRHATGMAIVPYHELLGRFHMRRRARRIGQGKASDAFIDVQIGDLVVHRDHGIAKFIGLRSMAAREGAAPEEFLTLEFARGSKLHVPASKIEFVQKYVGAFHGRPELSTLGGKRWGRQKDQVREAVQDLAAEMLRVQAARASLPGIRYPADTVWQNEFEAEFPYEETDDQVAAIAAIKRDMTNVRPMDRLVCGDVGFGKTEVAIRAAFKAAEYGKQVAVLVPTTLLAEQHERTFRQRFADYPFVVESLSRFKRRAEQTEILEQLRLGKVDIIIGTHRLLSNDVRFADLGVVVIDEEQRFGVEHKQKLLQYRATTDVLTLSATPIPRTLHMAMLGLRDISSLTTAPADRRAIVTEVMAYDSERIRQAIERELAREGQTYFVHNRVYNIQSVADDVQRLVPDARVVVGHGQMRPRELEKVMLQFYRGDADILVATTIIESGIDNPRGANTMVINDAQNFGLSDLHQLRGRVGRYKHRAYCYMMLPRDQTISEVAVKRLRAIESFSMLGAGFKIALRDLEIRGAGNLLGAEQSGHISAVGYEMYCQLLEEAVANLRHEHKPKVLDTTIDLGINGSIPKGYVPSDGRRMDAYRRIARCVDLAALERIEHDLVSAYGGLPTPTETLIQLAQLRVGAAMIGVRSMYRREKDVVIRTARPTDLEAALGRAKGTLRLVGQPDADGIAEVYYRPPANYWESNSILTVLRRHLT